MFNFKEYVRCVTCIKPGQKIFCEGERACLKIEKELNKKGIETKIGCNEGGMWSVYIESVPWRNEEIETDFNHKESIYDGCGIIDFKII